MFVRYEDEQNEIADMVRHNEKYALSRAIAERDEAIIDKARAWEQADCLEAERDEARRWARKYARLFEKAMKLYGPN